MKQDSRDPVVRKLFSSKAEGRLSVAHAMLVYSKFTRAEIVPAELYGQNRRSLETKISHRFQIIFQIALLGMICSQNWQHANMPLS